jgi:hypothetical protein
MNFTKELCIMIPLSFSVQVNGKELLLAIPQRVYRIK